MHSIRYFSAVQILLLVNYAYAGEVQLIDDLNDEELAHIVCNSPSGYREQIYRISTIERLTNYLSGLPIGHELATCWTDYGQSLILLQRILTTSNDDACDERKISLIEEFHRKFISRIQRARPGSQNLASSNDSLEAPERLILFFVHYAIQVARICSLNARSNMRILSPQDPEMLSLNESPSFHNLLNEFSSSFKLKDSLFSTGNKGNILLPWNIVDIIGASVAKHVTENLARYVNLATNITPENNYRVSIKMNNVENFKSTQNICHRFRSIYSRTILPVIKLIDLGYYPELENKIPQRAYEVTQLCETILPIRVFEDTALSEMQIVLLTRGEADREFYKQPSGLVSGEMKPLLRNSISNLKSLFSVAVTSSKQIKDIKTDIDSRARVVDWVLDRLAPNLEVYGKSNGQSLFLSRGPAEAEDLSITIERSIRLWNSPRYVEKRKDQAIGLSRNLNSPNPSANILLISPILYVSCLLMTLTVEV